MRIAICEDDQASRDFEKLLISRWGQANQVNITVDSYSSAENFLFESEDRLEYDLLVLDIQMGKMNGFELAKTLRARGFSGSLAFLTGIMDYALEGYEVGAVRYILKPVKEENLFSVLDKVFSELKTRKEEVFLLHIGNDLSKIPFKNIVYVEAQGHYVHLKGIEAGGNAFEKEWKANFGSVSNQLENQSFFCLKRGLLVNLSHVVKITRTECTLTSGETLPVARNNYEELNRAFIDFYKGQDQ